MDDRFEVFWTAYPLKAKKPDARKAWAKLSESDRDAALSAVVTYCEIWGRAPEKRRSYAGHPGTWLRNERWKENHEVWESAAAPRSTGSRGGLSVEPSFVSEGPGYDEIAREVLV